MLDAQRRGKIEKRTHWLDSKNKIWVSGPAIGEFIWQTIEVERQLLPILAARTRERVSLTLNYRRASRLSPVTALVQVADHPSIPDDKQSRGDNTILVGPTAACMSRTFVSVHALQCAVGTHANRQRRQLHRGVARRMKRYPQGQVEGQVPNIICEAGDGSASDRPRVDFRRAYRNHDCLIICYDNEQYANTGIQASSRRLWRHDNLFASGPAIPEGKKLFPKDLARMMAAGHPHCTCDSERGYPID